MDTRACSHKSHELIVIYPLKTIFQLHDKDLNFLLILFSHLCRVCGEVHIGDPPHKIRTCNVAGSAPNKEHTWEIGGIQHVFPTVESFHLYDRIGRAVSHNEQLQVDRIPAVVELCIQAGVDIPEYPTRRRTFPIYNVAGRTVDFEKRFPKKFTLEKGINSYGFWNDKKRVCADTLSINSDDLKGQYCLHF